MDYNYYSKDQYTTSTCNNPGNPGPDDVTNLPIFGHFCHPIFAHKNTKKAAEAAVL